MPLTTLTGTGNNTPVVRAGDGPTLLVNRDLVNHIIIGPDSGIGSGTASNLNSYSIVDPLGSVAVDGKSDVYAGVLEAGLEAELDTLQGATYWAPSPAQVAAQINALGLAKDTSVNAPAYNPANKTDVTTQLPTNISNTGVPLLNKASNLSNSSNIDVAAGATQNFGPFTISQIGYEIFWSAVNVFTGANNAFMVAKMTWSDSVSGQVVSQEYWAMSVGQMGSGGQKYFGTGPSKGDTLNIALTSFATSDINIAMSLNQHSRIYQRDDWRTVAPVVGVAGFTNPSSNPPGNILSETNIVIGSGSSISRLLPLYAGLVSYSFSPSAAETCSLVVVALDQITNGIAGAEIHNIVTSGTNGVEGTLSLPRSVCQFTLTNTGGTSATWTGSIVIQEQPQ